MELSNFIPTDFKEMILLNIEKSNFDVVENTHSKPQETLEFKIKKQKDYFSFNVPLELSEKWMIWSNKFRSR